MPVRGLYAITPALPDTDVLLDKVQQAMAGGIAALQYRNKVASPALRTEQATALLALTRPAGVLLIINDDPDLCIKIDADGVHLGAEDHATAETRRRLGATKIIGCSCYNRLDLAVIAEQQGASYVAFGSCFASLTKATAVAAPLTLFAAAKAQISLPLVGIGGITRHNAHLVRAAGADAIAVISALWQAPDITQAARTLTETFIHAPS